MRILIASDAWLPQVNGVVRTFTAMVRELDALGHRVMVIGPDRFLTVPMPSYPEIRLALASKSQIARLIDRFEPEAIHVPVEGPIGFATRRLCRERGWAFSSSYHTRAGRYFEEKFKIPERLVLGLQRRFHNAAASFMVQTSTLQRELGHEGFKNIRRWCRGVDTAMFRPIAPPVELSGLERPVFAYVGRVSTEKNLELFLGLDLPGTKLVVGDGPQLALYRQRYPATVFTGYRGGDDLVAAYSAADVFMLPSRFETFGLVLLEALACGVPVAALPVPGPLDVIGDAPVGVLSWDLGSAARRALDIPRDRCRAYAQTFSWRRSAEEFAANLVPIRGRAHAPLPAAA